MSNLDEKVSKLPTITVTPLQTFIVGKLQSKRRFESVYYTTIICPARDEYSKPAVVEVRSKQPVGDVDDIVKINCLIGGYMGKPYNSTDQSTGEVKRVVPNYLTLDVIEN